MLDRLKKALFGKFDINKAAQEVENLYYLQKFTKAAQQASEVLPQSRSIITHDTDALGKILFYRGRALADLGQYRDALNPLLEAEDFYRSNFLEIINMQLNVDVGLGDCYLNLKQLDKALLIYSKIEKGDSMNEVSLLHLKVYNCMASIYLGKRDFQKAIDYYEKYLSAYETCYPDYDRSKQYDDVNRKKESLKAALKAKSLNFEGEEYSSGMISYHVGNGGGGIMDLMYAKYIVCELPDPSQIDLDEIFPRITRIEMVTYVKSEEIEGMGHKLEQKILKKLSKDEIEGLFNCLKINEDEISHIMNIGEFSLNLFADEDTLGSITYVDYGYIRWEDKWKDDAQLKKPIEFLEWLNSLGVIEPLNRV